MSTCCDAAKGRKDFAFYDPGSPQNDNQSMKWRQQLAKSSHLGLSQMGVFTSRHLLKHYARL